MHLGSEHSLSAHALESGGARFELAPHHLTTHGVILGMTGSGKTGLLVGLVEEALLSRIPVLIVDVKGDLPNLFLTFPRLAPEDFEPWVDEAAAARAGRTTADEASAIASRWRSGLATSGLGPDDVAALASGIAPRLITPGSTAGEPLHVLSALEQPSRLWQEDEELAQASLSAALSLLLRLIDRDGDPARSTEHVLLAHFAERRLRAGTPAGLRELLTDLASPPIATLGAMAVDDFAPPKVRLELAQRLNTLLASPAFASWRKGAALDIAEWMRPRAGRTPAVVVSVAHLDDEQRWLVLGLILDEVLSWVRTLSGTSELRALVLFDEVFGFLPPHPHNPPTKRPMLALMKQARAFGVGVVVATQNPMDVDYKALSNAGLWAIGRLQTDADRERVVEGLVGSDAGSCGLSAEELSSVLKGLPPRAFLVRNVHRKPATALLSTRWTLSWLRGPMTRRELSRLTRANSPPAAPSAETSAPNADPDASAAPNARRDESAGNAGASPEGPLPVAPRGLAAAFFQVEAAQSERPITARPRFFARFSIHASDARLGVSTRATLVVVAPIQAGGPIDATRAIAVEETRLCREPPVNFRCVPVPAGLETKAAQQAAVRALRDVARASVNMRVLFHRELEIAQEPNETEAAFRSRCAASSSALAEKRRTEIEASHAPRLAKLRQRLKTAQAKQAELHAQTAALPPPLGGAIGTALVGLALGARHARRHDAHKDKLLEQRRQADAAVEEAAAALREAVAAAEAEITAALRAHSSRGEANDPAIEWRALVPKKGDIEVLEAGIAWVADSDVGA